MTSIIAADHLNTQGTRIICISLQTLNLYGCAPKCQVCQGLYLFIFINILVDSNNDPIYYYKNRKLINIICDRIAGLLRPNEKLQFITNALSLMTHRYV